MKKIAVIFFGMLAMYACKKKQDLIPIQPPVPVPPPMTMIDLKDTAVRFNRAVILDIDNDGANDIYFTTLLVGDPVMQQDKWQWLVSGAFDTNFPVNINESLPVLALNDAVTAGVMPGYTWYNAASVLLAQKILSVAIPPYWMGDWKNVSHRYIPFQLIKATGLYTGWVEISFSTDNEKLVLHKAAVCKELNKDIRAGN
jgi:hypothetical protein